MTVGQVASKALATANYIRGMVNCELHNYDEAQTATAIDNSGSVTSLIDGIAQGDTNNTFTGNSLLLKRVQLRGTIAMHASATSTRVRLMVVLDKRPPSSGTPPVVTDILNTAAITSFLNIENQIGRFKVLMDRTYVVNTQFPERPFTFFRKLSLHCKFNDSQELSLNDVLILQISDESTNTPTVAFNSRLRYYDN